MGIGICGTIPAEYNNALWTRVPNGRATHHRRRWDLHINVSFMNSTTRDKRVRRHHDDDDDDDERSRYVRWLRSCLTEAAARSGFVFRHRV